MKIRIDEVHVEDLVAAYTDMQHLYEEYIYLASLYEDHGETEKEYQKRQNAKGVRMAMNILKEALHIEE